MLRLQLAYCFCLEFKLKCRGVNRLVPQRKMLLLLSLKLLFTRSECYVVFYLNNIIVHGSLIFIPVESSGFLREPNCSARQGSSGNQAYTESKSCARRNRKCWSPQTDSEKGEIPETYSQRMAYDFFCPFFFFFFTKMLRFNSSTECKGRNHKGG